MTTIYKRADALKVKTDPTTEVPEVSLGFPTMPKPSTFIWDTMPLRSKDNKVVSFNGWTVIFTLTAFAEYEKYTVGGKYDITDDWVHRHDRAVICFWYAKNPQSAKDFIFGGRVMEDGVSPSKAEWAGTPVLLDDKGNIDLYYTCIAPTVNLSKVKGQIHADDKRVWLSGFKEVKNLLEADGVYYQTQQQNGSFNFRDPCPFIDPKDGQLYMLFEGNIGGQDHLVGYRELGQLPPNHKNVGGNSNNRIGCIGIAKALDEEGDTWELLPPLISAVGVNDQLERPHIIFKDGKYYVFTISHEYTHADGVEMPDGLYGFVADTLFGDYKPLNGSGLVLGLPRHQPLQTYSWYIMQDSFEVTSFIERVTNYKDGGWRIGGTLAPTLKIAIEGSNTYLTEVKDYGHIRATKHVKSVG